MKAVIATYLLFFAVALIWVFWKAFIEVPIRVGEPCFLLAMAIAVASVVIPLVALFLATRAWNAGYWALAPFLPIAGLMIGAWLNWANFWIRYACTGR